MKELIFCSRLRKDAVRCILIRQVQTNDSDWLKFIESDQLKLIDCVGHEGLCTAALSRMVQEL